MILRMLGIAVVSFWSAAAIAAPPPTSSTEAVSYIDQTNAIERFRYLERLDVTSEKPVAAKELQEPLPASVEAILRETEALEADPTP